MMEQLSSLIASARQGDMEAFNTLYEYSYSTVEHECLRVLRNTFDAEDAIQESYLHIYKRLDSLKDPDKFLSWCRTIAHNASVSYISVRHRKVGKDDFKPPISYEDFEGMDSLDGIDDQPTPEEKAEQKMLHALLQEAVDNIAPQRAICLAWYQQGLSYQDISDRLSLPLGTVKSNIHYAKEALKKEIRDIEKREKIQIFGFTLVPVGETVEVRMAEPDSSGFIQAEMSDSMKGDIWESLSGQLSKSTASQGPLWQKITAVVVALVVIVGGIVFAVYRAGRTNYQDERAVTTITQGLPNAPGNGRLAPSGRANVAAGNNGEVLPGPELTAAVTERQTTAPAPSIPEETTRESFTNRTPNLRDAIQGNN